MSVPDENDEATNTNCLDGMVCSSCKSEGDFNIGVSGTALVSDDGIVDIEDADWDDDSSCDCRECTFRGKVSDFLGEKSQTSRVEPEKGETRPIFDINPPAPAECPKCNADLGAYFDNSHRLHLVDSDVFQEVHCPNDDCGYRWYDYYAFYGTVDCSNNNELVDYRPPVYCVASEMLDMLKAVCARLGLETGKHATALDTESYICGAIHDDMKALIAKAEKETP